MKKALKIVSWAHVVFWIACLVYCVIERLSYVPPANEPPLGMAMAIGIYNIFVWGSALALFSAMLLSIVLHIAFSERAVGCNGLKKAAVFSSVITNISMYVLIYTLLIIDRDWILIFILIWIAVLLITLVLLIVLSVKTKFYKKEPVEDTNT